MTSILVATVAMLVLGLASGDFRVAAQVCPMHCFVVEEPAAPVGAEPVAQESAVQAAS